ncbi:MAG: phosphopantetheine-binding protein [Vicingaceae bacterium]|nr:phosphopantetheine-binding protein [Vicingaceae bacterium]
MSKEKLLTEVQLICREIFKKPELTISESTSSDDVEGWDSITNVFFIDQIEKKFDTKLSLMDIMDMDNIGDLLSILEKQK